MSDDLRTRDGLARLVARAIDDWSASSLPMSASEFVAARLLAGRVLDADPDTPTADAPADTDLRDALTREVMAGYYDNTIVDRVLPLVRAQVEAARRDALNEAADEIAASFPPNGELRPDGTEDPQAAAYVEGLHDAGSIVLDLAARGETRQP